MVSSSLHGKGQMFGGIWAFQCTVQGEYGISHAKTAELIELPFGMVSWVGSNVTSYLE